MNRNKTVSVPASGRRMLALTGGILLAVAVLAAGSVRAQGGADPLSVIRESNDRILEIYHKHRHIGESERRRIFSIMDAVTDFETMAARAVDPVCCPGDVQTCQRLKEVFKELLRLSAIHKLGRYRADRFEYLGQQCEADTAEVNTIAHYQDEAIHLDYILSRRKGRWMIVNYIVDDIDTVANYRRQFTRILEKKPMSSLVERLQARVNQYRRNQLTGLE